ncbi:hypothetical protein KDA11_05545 [Candidatus Saccharibacteria bacterium]|nr:hypothetical protein [Candidatus Saccharibacteria bacterium]
MGVVIIYKEPNFEGDQIPLRDGVHKESGFEFEDFTHIRSLRVEKYTVANIQGGPSRSSSRRVFLRGPVEVADLSTMFEKIWQIEVYTLNEFLSGGYHPGRVRIYNQTDMSGRWHSLQRGFYDEHRLKSREVHFNNGRIESLCIDCGMAVFLYSAGDSQTMPSMFLLGPTDVADVSNIGFHDGVRAIDVVPLRGYDNSRIPWQPKQPDELIVITEKNETPEYVNQAPVPVPKWVSGGFILCFVLIAVLASLIVILYLRGRGRPVEGFVPKRQEQFPL